MSRIPNLLICILTHFVMCRMKATSVRRRTKQEIIDQKAAALAKEEAIQDKLKTIDRLHIELQKV